MSQRTAGSLNSQSVVGQGASGIATSIVLATLGTLKPGTGGGGSGSAANVPTTMQADFVLLPHTQVDFRRPIRAQAGQRIQIPADSALVGAA